MQKYSVIIPTLNEEYFLQDCINSIRKGNPDTEIIIVDGGSTDSTLSIARNEKVKIVQTVPSRGEQLIEGTKIANGDIYVFLHADTLLPENWYELLNDYFNENVNQVCRFKLNFDIKHWILDRYKFFSKYDSIFSRFGDMCICIRKNFYNEIKGFSSLKIFEDVELLQRITKIKKIDVLNADVITSARTFIRFGLIRQQIFNGIMIFKYLLGFRKFIISNKYYNRKEKKKKSSIIVFVKYPEEGKVKTRLAATIGNKNATILYKKISEQIIQSIQQIKKSNKYIFFSDINDEKRILKWLGDRFFYSVQEGHDLGEKMSNAFRKVFSHNAKKAIIVGSDVPELSKDIINKALQQLDDFDVVVGPSVDGGYYLLGMKNYFPFLFEDIKFSSENVLSETIKKIQAKNLSYVLLEKLRDIDTENDLIEWINETQNLYLKKDVGLFYNLTKGKVEIKCVHCSQ
ncbi:MAG: hypothetical protein Fur0015_07110 [Ignavibacteriales bacterium]